MTPEDVHGLSQRVDEPLGALGTKGLDYSFEPVLFVSTLWFGPGEKELTDETVKAVSDRLEGDLRRAADTETPPPAVPILRKCSHGHITLFSADENQSISVCSKFVEMRTNDHRIPSAKLRVIPSVQSLVGAVLENSSGLTLEIQGIAGMTSSVPDYGRVATIGLLQDHFRTGISRIFLQSELSASIRLFLGAVGVDYTVDVGLDLRNPQRLFVRQRSKRTDHCRSESFIEAWDADAEVWCTKTRQLVDLVLRGEA